MASTDPVGTVQAIYLKSVDQLGNLYETNITGNKFGVNPNTTYQSVNGALRALNNLTTNNYVDTILITAISVNEAIEEV